MASTVSRSQTQKTEEMGCGKSRRLSLDTWISVPVRISSDDLVLEGPCIPMPVRTSSDDLVSEGPCTPQKALSSNAKSALTESSSGEEECFIRGAACQTPQSTRHRIPEVDMDMCPPAPKKPRGMRRLVFACATECESADDRQKLSMSPGYLF